MVNMIKRERLFAGYNKEEGTMAFIEIEIRTYEGKNTFTLCANECYVAKWGEVEKEDYVASVLDCMDDEWLLDRLKEHDCPWSELPENLVREFEYNDAFGEHCYEVSKLQDNDGNEYQCDITGCGQCDIRKFVEPLTPQIGRLLDIWDLYHLKSIPAEVEQEVKDLIDEYEVVTEKLAEEKYNGTYIADAIFKEICEYYFKEEGLY